jgi:hypothetical protein
MPAPVRVRSSGPLPRPATASCIAGKAGSGNRYTGGLVALTDEGQGHVAAEVGQGLDGQGSHLTGAQAHHAAQDGDRVVCPSK